MKEEFYYCPDLNLSFYQIHRHLNVKEKIEVFCVALNMKVTLIFKGIDDDGLRHCKNPLPIHFLNNDFKRYDDEVRDMYCEVIAVIKNKKTREERRNPLTNKLNHVKLHHDKQNLGRRQKSHPKPKKPAPRLGR